MDWLAKVNRFFDCMEISEERWVRLVAHRLKGVASALWERLLDTRRYKGRGHVRT